MTSGHTASRQALDLERGAVNHHWRRVCVDLDLAGGPIGWSVEWHVGDERVEIYVVGHCDPFEPPADVFAVAVAARRVQPELPFTSQDPHSAATAP